MESTMNYRELRTILEAQKDFIQAVPNLILLHDDLAVEVRKAEDLFNREFAGTPRSFSRERLSPAVRAKYEILQKEFSVLYQTSFSEV